MRLRPAILNGLVLCGTLIPSFAADRVALVIGNSTYQNATKLANATSDSTAIARLLRGAGFEVIGSAGGVSDASTEQFYDALEKFKQAASGAKVGLVYFAGHGVEVDGKNYLLPVDASLESAANLRTQAVALDTILADMKEARLPAKMVILDCCRDNPLTRSWLTTRSTKRGMAEVKEDSLPEATMIMFSTAPGMMALDGTGGNSPFTKALLANLALSGTNSFEAFLNVSDAVAAETNDRQVPWIRFDGAGRAFRLLTFVPQMAIPDKPSPSLPMNADTRAMTQDEVRRFRHYCPDADQFFKITIGEGQSVSSWRADVSTSAAYALLFQDECRFVGKSLQPGTIQMGSDMETGITFIGGNHVSPQWNKEPGGRILMKLRRGISYPLFSSQQAGFSVNSINAGADLAAPAFLFSYQMSFYENEAEDSFKAEIESGKITGKSFKTAVLIFAKP